MSHGMLQMDFPVDRWALAYPRVCRKLCLLAMIFKGDKAGNIVSLKGYGNIFFYYFIWKNFYNYMLISFTDFA
jgi:hypothetical protein